MAVQKTLQLQPARGKKLVRLEMDELSVNIEAIQSELESKEELVLALTRQLEQAAQHLERAQRPESGQTSPTSASSETTLSKEFTQQQNNVARDVSYLVQQWDASQVAGSIGRIEIQLKEMRDLISQTVNPSTQLIPSSSELEIDHHDSSKPHDSSEEDSSQADLIRSLQAAFLQSEEEIPETVLNEYSSEVPEIEAESSEEKRGAVFNKQLPEQPELIDFDSASIEELKQAVLGRDHYIEVIVAHLSQVKKQTRIPLPADWETLERCPEKMVQRVQQLEQQLQDQLRLSEVSLSLERARLSREETELTAAKIQIQKELRKLGVNPNNIQGLDLPEETEKITIEEEEPKRAKWLDMLRIKSEA